MIPQIDIYNYFDYREYLLAVYSSRKEHEKGFSHRSFSREAGIASPNYLLRVLNGERSLSDEYCQKFCKALNLQRNESFYFSTLVEFNNESEAAKKEDLLRTLLSIRYRRGIHRINDKKLQFFSKWYYPVIRELATLLNTKDDYNALSRTCIPKITAQQAENAVAYLLKNDFLQTDGNGTVIRSNPVISSGNEVSSTIMRNYHKQTLTQSIDALDSIEKENRGYLLTYTQCFPEDLFGHEKGDSGFQKKVTIYGKRGCKSRNGLSGRVSITSTFKNISEKGSSR